MKYKKDINYPEYSLKDILSDYINFILVLILGLVFHQKGTDITYFFLMQIGMLVICFVLTLIYYLFKAHITSKKKSTSYSFSYYYSCIIWYWVGIGFFIALSVLLYDILTSNFPINLVCFPSVLYAYRKIFQKLKQDLSEVTYIFIKAFMIVGCVPLLLVIPEFFKDIGLADTISFFICYSVLCFPYKGTFNLLFSPKIKKKFYDFFSNPAKLFGLAWTCFSLAFLLVACHGYWIKNDEAAKPLVLFIIPFICVGIIMLLKWK